MNLDLIRTSLLLACAVGQSRGVPRQVPTPGSEVAGVLLVTGDPAEAKRAHTLSLATDPEILREFPAKRYDSVRWKEKYRIVIDRTTGPLGAIFDRTILTRAFAAASAGTLDLDKMTPEESGALKAWVKDWPQVGQPPTRQVPDSLGLHVERYMALKAGGETRNFDLPTPDSRWDAAKAALGKRILNKQAALEKRAPSVGPISPLPRDEYQFVYLGIAGVERTEAIVQAAETIGKIEARLRSEANMAAKDLMLKLGYRLSDDGARGDASGLSPEVRYQIADQLRNGWQNMGFASQAEALGFLDRAGSFEIHTTLSMYQTLSPGDPARSMPSTGIQWRIQDLLGTYGP